MAQKSQLWLALRLSGWLCRLPFHLRIRTLPALLDSLTSAPEQPREIHPRELGETVRMVLRICHFPLFRLPVFPRACLRQALALYHVLTRLGYPTAIHFGVDKEGGAVRAHSWVTVDGKAVAERPATAGFHTIYTYPPLPAGGGQTTAGLFGANRSSR